MTTMPARPVLLITVLGAALPLLLSPVMVTAMRQFYLATSPAAIVVNIGLVSSIESATFLVFLFHTVRQLRVVSRVHNHYSHVSMFRLQSLYGLSSLTARTALVFVLIGAVAYATRGSEPTSPVGSQLWVDPVAVGLGYLVLSVTTAGAVFAFPLIGLHRMLVKEKEGLQVETDRRLERAMEDLHRLLDASELERIDGLSKAISTLVTEREVIRRMPTWPWSPGALKVLVSAVVTPIVVWLLQYALERTVLP